MLTYEQAAIIVANTQKIDEHGFPFYRNPNGKWNNDFNGCVRLWINFVKEKEDEYIIKSVKKYIVQEGIQ